jgi:Ice-binding-like
MRCKSLFVVAITILSGAPRQAKADLTLGTAGNFAVLAGNSATSGSSVTTGGYVGAMNSVTGYSGSTDLTGGSVVSNAMTSFNTAFNAASHLQPTQTLSGNLNGLTLTSGVYYLGNAAQLSGTLTLNDQGNPNAQFVFQIGSALTTASGWKVMTINGGSASGNNVFWEVGNAATLGTNSTFEGHILAGNSIVLGSGATILNGSAVAGSSVVLSGNNHITNTNTLSAPEPSTLPFALIGGGAMMGIPALGRWWREGRKG